MMWRVMIEAIYREKTNHPVVHSLKCNLLLNQRSAGTFVLQRGEAAHPSQVVDVLISLVEELAGRERRPRAVVPGHSQRYPPFLGGRRLQGYREPG